MYIARVLQCNAEMIYIVSHINLLLLLFYPHFLLEERHGRYKTDCSIYEENQGRDMLNE